MAVGSLLLSFKMAWVIFAAFFEFDLTSSSFRQVAMTSFSSRVCLITVVRVLKSEYFQGDGANRVALEGFSIFLRFRIFLMSEMIWWLRSSAYSAFLSILVSSKSGHFSRLIIVLLPSFSHISSAVWGAKGAIRRDRFFIASP